MLPIQSSLDRAPLHCPPASEPRQVKLRAPRPPRTRMPHLYLVRHAQPDFAGHYDSVTDLGLQQAVWLGEHLAACGLGFARVACGSLQRQAQTLEALLRHVPGPPPPLVDPRFNEYD